MLLADYPGYTRAIARAAQLEELLHDLPFLSALEKIRGISVRQLTPRMCGLLLFARSTFMYKGAVRGVDDVARFLWIVSPDYKPDQKAADRFMRKLPLIAATREGKLYPVFRAFERAIDRYVDRAFIDQPAMCANSATVFPVAYQAAIVHPIARAYHWDEERILDTPIARLYQFLKLIQRERGAIAGELGTPAFYPYQDRIRRRIVMRWHRRAQALGVSVEDCVALFSRGQKSEVRSQASDLRSPTSDL
jgi:hypothetical protein